MSSSLLTGQISFLIMGSTKIVLSRLTGCDHHPVNQDSFLVLDHAGGKSDTCQLGPRFEEG